MTLGFADPARRDALIGELRGWELDEVIVEKYNVSFLFESGSCLLNVARRFAYVSADQLTSYRYDVQADGGRKALDVDRILRVRIGEVVFPDNREMNLVPAKPKRPVTILGLAEIVRNGAWPADPAMVR